MKKRGPWKVKSGRTVYKNPWMTVREDSVIDPGGRPSVFGVVTIQSGVSVIPIDEQGNIYLAKEYQYAIGKIDITAVSGGMEKGESVLASAKRELREETGLRAKKWTYLGVVDPFTSKVFSRTYMYLAEGLSQGKADLEAQETLTVVKVPFKRAVQWVMESKITHSGTCVAILKAEKYLKTKSK